METIGYEYEQGIASITLRRPSKRNAVNREMTKELQELLGEIRQEPQLKAMILTGEGEQAFCAGGDLRELNGDLSKGEAFDLLSPMRHVLYEIASFPVPTVAFLNGEARGGGCELATACDFRYGRPDGRYGFVQGTLGIVPGWGGGALLHKRIGHTEAAHWLVRSDMISVTDAVDIGWVQKVQEEFTPAFLETKSRQQLMFWKKQLLDALELKKLHADMKQETEQAAALWGSDSHKRAVRGFFDRGANKR